jgi:hypothetical protein
VIGVDLLEIDYRSVFSVSLARDCCCFSNGRDELLLAFMSLINCRSFTTDFSKGTLKGGINL